jgi:hypothetical protein
MAQTLNIRKLRGLRWVRRFNFHQNNHYENVAEHSYFVTVIAHEIAIVLGLCMPERFRVMYMALFHDAEEAVTGDIPHLVKRFLPPDIVQGLEDKAAEELGLLRLTDFVAEKIVLLADCLEMKMHLEEERESGNWMLLPIEQETMGRIQELVEQIGADESQRREIMSWIEVIDPAAFPVHLSHEGEYGTDD